MKSTKIINNRLTKNAAVLLLIVAMLLSLTVQAFATEDTTDTKTLNAKNFQVFKANTLLTDTVTGLKNGDSLNVKFDWDVGTTPHAGEYSTLIPIEHLTLRESKEGDLTFDGVNVGTYSFSMADENAVLFKVNLTDEFVDLYTGIVGGATFEAEFVLSDDSELIDVKAGDAAFHVKNEKDEPDIPDEPDVPIKHSLSKHSKVNDDGSITYTIDVNVEDVIHGNIFLSDTMSDNGIIKKDTLKVYDDDALIDCEVFFENKAWSQIYEYVGTNNKGWMFSEIITYSFVKDLKPLMSEEQTSIFNAGTTSFEDKLKILFSLIEDEEKAAYYTDLLDEIGLKGFLERYVPIEDALRTISGSVVKSQPYGFETILPVSASDEVQNKHFRIVYDANLSLYTDYTANGNTATTTLRNNCESTYTNNEGEVTDTSSVQDSFKITIHKTFRNKIGILKDATYGSWWDISIEADAPIAALMDSAPNGYFVLHENLKYDDYWYYYVTSTTSRTEDDLNTAVKNETLVNQVNDFFGFEVPVEFIKTMFRDASHYRGAYGYTSTWEHDSRPKWKYSLESASGYWDYNAKTVIGQFIDEFKYSSDFANFVNRSLPSIISSYSSYPSASARQNIEGSLNYYGKGIPYTGENGDYSCELYLPLPAPYFNDETYTNTIHLSLFNSDYAYVDITDSDTAGVEAEYNLDEMFENMDSSFIYKWPVGAEEKKNLSDVFPLAGKTESFNVPSTDKQDWIIVIDVDKWLSLPKQFEELYGIKMDDSFFYTITDTVSGDNGIDDGFYTHYNNADCVSAGIISKNDASNIDLETINCHGAFDVSDVTYNRIDEKTFSLDLSDWLNNHKNSIKDAYLIVKLRTRAGSKPYSNKIQIGPSEFTANANPRAVSIDKEAKDYLYGLRNGSRYVNTDKRTVSWEITLTPNNIKNGSVIVIEDTMEQAVHFREDSLIAFFENKTQCDDYILEKTDTGFKITINCTEGLKTLFNANGGKLHFAYIGDLDDSVTNEDLIRGKAYNNTATAYVDGVQQAQSSALAAPSNTKPFIKKQSANNEAGHPIPVFEKNKIYGEYVIDVNPEAYDLRTDTFTVEDIMSNVMELDEQSVKVINAETDKSIDDTLWSYSLEDKKIRFILPDRIHLRLEYRVKLNVDPILDPKWMRPENTKNSVIAIIDDVNTHPNSYISFDSYQMSVSAWIRGVVDRLPVPTGIKTKAAALILPMIGLCIVFYIVRRKVKR